MIPPAWFAYEYSAESESESELESEHIRDIIAELRPNLEILPTRCDEQQQKNCCPNYGCERVNAIDLDSRA